VHWYHSISHLAFGASTHFFLLLLTGSAKALAILFAEVVVTIGDRDLLPNLDTLNATISMPSDPRVTSLAFALQS
jgi:hypothetical protein